MKLSAEKEAPVWELRHSCPYDPYGPMAIWTTFSGFFDCRSLGGELRGPQLLLVKMHDSKMFFYSISVNVQGKLKLLRTTYVIPGVNVIWSLCGSLPFSCCFVSMLPHSFSSWARSQTRLGAVFGGTRTLPYQPSSIREFHAAEASDRASMHACMHDDDHDDDDDETSSRMKQASEGEMKAAGLAGGS